MHELKFYVCKHCGNMVLFIKNSGVPIVCCGENMVELVADSTDASIEKHVPDTKIEDGVIHVQIGSTPHPMIEEHYIVWIYLQTEKGGQLKYLNPNKEPKTSFTVVDDKPLAVYAYCNIHGLWKADIK